MEAPQYVGGYRLVHLRKGDARRVARVLAAHGALARLQSTQGVLYIRVDTPRDGYAIIRHDDWRMIFPFIRYSSLAIGNLDTPHLGPEPPPDVPSTQPNLRIPSWPINPGSGLTSFLAGFDYPTYRRIVNLLPLCRTGAEFEDWMTVVLEQLFPADFPTH